MRQEIELNIGSEEVVKSHLKSVETITGESQYLNT